MKRSLFRPTAVLLPASFFVSMIAGKQISTLSVFYAYTALLLFSGSAAGTFRNAAASEPGVRRIDSRFFGSLIQWVVGSVMTMIICMIISPPFGISAAICAALLMFERLFEERLFAIGRCIDAQLLSLLTAVLFCGGMLLDIPIWCCITIPVIAAIITFVNQPFKTGKIIFSWSFIPNAIFRDFMCPLVLSLSVMFLSVRPEFAVCSWAISEVCRTFARCTQEETRRPLLIISVLIFLACLVPTAFHGYIPAVAVCISAVITVLTGSYLGLRTLICTALYCAAAVMSYSGYYAISVIPPLAACVVSFDRRIFFRKV